MNNYHKQALRGFTLIELLLIITLIGVLAIAVIALLNPVGQFQKAQDAKRKSDLAQIQRLLELYYNDNDEYPNSLNFGANWAGYSQLLPDDPKLNKHYDYRSVAGNQTYYMYASLDRGAQDPDRCKPNGAVCTNANVPGVSCGSGVCNYGVSSSDTLP